MNERQDGTEDHTLELHTNSANKQPLPRFDLDFYVTDHSADGGGRMSEDEMRALYAAIRNHGIQSIRYDWHWREIEKKQGRIDEAQVSLYQRSHTMMQEAGLDEPTIILSNPPSWAVALYKKDKEAFFKEYRRYAEAVRDGLPADAETKVERVQILNELNNSIYNPIATEDLPRMCDIAREVFKSYNPDIKLMVTILVVDKPDLGPTTGIVTDTMTYLPQLKAIKDSFDVIALDYYPGFWHMPLLAPDKWTADQYQNMDHLRETMEEVSGWGKEYELGEVGLPTKKFWAWGKDDPERNQRYFFDAFFRSFSQLLGEFQKEGKRLPTKVGLYQAIDEAPQTIGTKIMRLLTPHPEFDMGLHKADHTPKLILEGNLHRDQDRGISQIQKIIRYMTGRASEKRG